MFLRFSTSLVFGVRIFLFGSMDMDTSWIELPNSHPSYIAGTVKSIKVAKEGLVEGKSLCPCKKCMVKSG